MDPCTLDMIPCATTWEGILSEIADCECVITELLSFSTACRIRASIGREAYISRYGADINAELDGLIDLTSSIRTEGLLSDAIIGTVKYLWEELKLLVMAIIRGLGNLFKLLFDRRTAALRELKWYQDHFAKTPPDNGRLGRHHGMIPNNANMVAVLLSLKQVSYRIAPIMELFKAQGQLSYVDLQRIGAITDLTNAGFAVNDTEDGPTIDMAQSKLPELAQSTFAEQGWTSTAVTMFINDCIGLDDSVSQLKQIQLSLPETLYNNIVVKVRDDDTAKRYTAGTIFIDRMLVLYANVSMELFDRATDIAATARQYCG